MQKKESKERNPFLTQKSYIQGVRVGKGYLKQEDNVLTGKLPGYNLSSTHLRALTNASIHGVIWSLCMRSVG